MPPLKRSFLVHLAEKLGRKPKFLFPESRDENATRREKPLLTKERETTLKLILGMAMSKYRYEPSSNHSPVPSNIVKSLEQHGIKIDVDTVRKWLKEAANHHDDFKRKY